MTRKNLIAIAATALLTVPASLAGIGDVQPADPMRISPLLDIDHDGMIAFGDNCPFTYNPNQMDSDADGTGDVCDVTPWSPGGSAGGPQPDCTIFGEDACGVTDPEQN